MLDKLCVHQCFDCVQGLEQSNELLSFPIISQQTQTGHGEAGSRMLQLSAQQRHCINLQVFLSLQGLCSTVPNVLCLAQLAEGLS